MKDNMKKKELRDISGTVCVSNAYLAYLKRAKCSAYLVRIWPLFYYPRLHRGYCQNNFKNEMKELRYL